jgi:hypothetical protein
VARYRCVDTQRAKGFPVTAACEAAGVSTSAYYDWCARRDQGPSDRQREDARLLAEIRAIHTDSDGTYGSPRVTAELWRHGWKVNHKKVEAMMRRHGIVGHRPVRRRSLTKADESAAAIPDLVGRRFDPTQLELDYSWASDITYSAQFAVMCSSAGYDRQVQRTWGTQLNIIRGRPGRRGACRLGGTETVLGWHRSGGARLELTRSDGHLP